MTVSNFSILTTQSGSVYELDLDNKRIRRMVGKHDATERQGKDGEWKRFAGVSTPRLGEALLIIWRYDLDDEGRTVARSTMTSAVTHVNGVQSQAEPS